MHVATGAADVVGKDLTDEKGAARTANFEQALFRVVLDDPLLQHFSNAIYGYVAALGQIHSVLELLVHQWVR